MKIITMILMAIFILPACSEKTQDNIGLVFAIFSIVLGLIFLYFENNQKNYK